MFQSESFIQAFARSLGSMLGSFIGTLLAVFIFVLIIFLFWGLPWERLISKAGFTGRWYWFLLGLFFVPPLIGFTALNLFGENSNITQLFGSLFGVSTYLGFLILAFFPWNVHRKLRQIKNSKIASNP